MQINGDKIKTASFNSIKTILSVEISIKYITMTSLLGSSQILYFCLFLLLKMQNGTENNTTETENNMNEIGMYESCNIYENSICRILI